jgi:hypothetical protein
MATRVRAAKQVWLQSRRQEILKELTQVCEQMGRTQQQIVRLEKRIVSLMKARKKAA